MAWLGDWGDQAWGDCKQEPKQTARCPTVVTVQVWAARWALGEEASARRSLRLLPGPPETLSSPSASIRVSGTFISQQGHWYMAHLCSHWSACFVPPTSFLSTETETAWLPPAHDGSGPAPGVVITGRPNLDWGLGRACGVKGIMRDVKTWSKGLPQSSHTYTRVYSSQYFRKPLHYSQRALHFLSSHRFLWWLSVTRCTVSNAWVVKRENHLACAIL